MKLIYTLFLLVAFNVISNSCKNKKYTPDWDSLDSRPLPSWYDDAKVGIFIHWGVFSVPAFKSEWFWWYWKGTSPKKDVVDFMKDNYPPDFSYNEFAKDFTAQYYNPDQWAELFQAAGAKYVVLTTKHHEGFCMWPSKNSWNWNSMDIGPGRDIVGEFANSIRTKTNLTFGLYHSLFEWFNPLYQSDEKSGFKEQEFVKEKTMPELYDLINTYKPEILWSDGEGSGKDTYWNSTQFVAWLFNESPVKETVVVNDRWGVGDLCHHGSFYTCDDRYNPGKLQNHKWENCMTLDLQSWGFRNNMQLSEVMTINDLITSLVETISCGGNILINIGPTKDGIIVPIFEERLRQLGSWLDLNGEAIYESRPWKHQNDTTNSNVWYTISKDNSVYAILLKYRLDQNVVIISAPKVTKKTTIEIIGYKNEVNWTLDEKGAINIDLSKFKADKLPSMYGLVFKLKNTK